MADGSSSFVAENSAACSMPVISTVRQLLSLVFVVELRLELVIGHAYPATDPHRVRSLKGFDDYSVTEHPDPR
jgi:hypothetical protein